MKRALRIFAWLLLVPALLVAIYLTAINSALNLAVGRRLMNSHPERVHVTYDRAWTLWPGRIHVINADISGQDSHVQFEISADEATVDFSPRGLSDRIVTVGHLRGHGFSVRIRTRMRTEPSPAELAKLPEIRGLPSPLMDPGPYIPPTIGARLLDIDVQRIRELWVDDYRFTGDIDVKGGLYFKPGRALRIHPATIAVRDGALSTGANKVVDGLRGNIQASLEELDLRTADIQALKLASVQIAVHAKVKDIGFLNYYLTRAPQIRLEDGAGDLSVNVIVDHGILGPGGLVEVASPHIVLVLPFFNAIGSGHITFKVNGGEHDHTDVAVALASVIIVQRSDNKAYLRGNSIRVDGHTNDLDLTHPPELELRVELPDASGTDLTFLNNFVPDGIPMKIISGAGKLAGHFSISTVEHHIDGMADIHGSNLAVRNKTARLNGAAHLHGVLKSLDWQSLQTDLSGSYLSLDDVTIAIDGKETPHWWARADLPSCLVHPKGRNRMDGLVRLRIKNLKPVIGVVAANVKLPWIVKALADREDLRAEAHLKAGETSLGLTGIKVTSGSFSALGQLRFSDLRRKPPGAEGIMLITWGALAVGLELHGPKAHAVIITPTKWYERQKATLAAAR